MTLRDVKSAPNVTTARRRLFNCFTRKVKATRARLEREGWVPIAVAAKNAGLRESALWDMVRFGRVLLTDVWIGAGATLLAPQWFERMRPSRLPKSICPHLRLAVMQMRITAEEAEDFLKYYCTLPVYRRRKHLVAPSVIGWVVFGSPMHSRTVLPKAKNPSLPTVHEVRERYKRKIEELEEQAAARMAEIRMECSQMPDGTQNETDANDDQYKARQFLVRLRLADPK